MKKYIEGVKNRQQEEEAGDKAIERSAKKGKSDLQVQIAKLKGKIVEAEAEVETKQEEYDNSKFSMPFELAEVDSAELALANAKAALKKRQDDLKSRESLIKELFSK